MDTDPEGTFDYIWVRGDTVELLTAGIIGNLSKEDDPTIYPSDHYGILARVSF